MWLPCGIVKRATFKFLSLGSLSNNVFERRTLTGSGLFSFFDGSFAQIFSQIASITVKKLRNTNFISSRHVKRENTSLPIDERRSKTSLLKLPIVFLDFFRRLTATSSLGRFSLAKRSKDEVGLADCSDPSLEEETFVHC